MKWRQAVVFGRQERAGGTADKSMNGRVALDRFCFEDDVLVTQGALKMLTSEHSKSL